MISYIGRLKNEAASLQESRTVEKSSKKKSDKALANNSNNQLTNTIKTIEEYINKIQLNNEQPSSQIQSKHNTQVPINEIDMFLTHISNITINTTNTTNKEQITDKEWLIIQNLSLLGFVSISKYYSILNICLHTSHLDILLYIIKFSSDLSERVFIHIINELLLLSDESFISYTNTTTESTLTTTSSTAAQVDSTNTSGKKKKVSKSKATTTTTTEPATETYTTSTDMSNVDSTALGRWNYFYLLLHITLTRNNAFSNILLTETIKKHLAPPRTSFILRCLATLVHNYFNHMPILPILNSHNYDRLYPCLATTHSSATMSSVIWAWTEPENEKRRNYDSLLELNEIHINRCIIWIESCLDAHYGSTAISNVYNNTTRQALKSLFLSLNTLKNTSNIVEMALGLTTHIYRMNIYNNISYKDRKPKTADEILDLNSAKNSLEISGNKRSHTSMLGGSGNGNDKGTGSGNSGQWNNNLYSIEKIIL